MVVLLIVFIYVGTAAMGSIFAVFSNGIFVGILSTAGIFSLISSIFISALPYILGVGAISIIYDSIRMLFS